MVHKSGGGEVENISKKLSTWFITLITAFYNFTAKFYWIDIKFKEMVFKFRAHSLSTLCSDVRK